LIKKGRWGNSWMKGSRGITGPVIHSKKKGLTEKGMKWAYNWEKGKRNVWVAKKRPGIEKVR